jgi:hypothetical protein
MMSVLNPLQTVPYSDIESAFLKSDANKIVSYGADKILISVSGKESIYSKSQAAIVLKDFFSKKPVEAFKITVKSQVQGSISFIAAEYSSSGTKYRISIQFKKVDEQFKIDKIVIAEI